MTGCDVDLEGCRNRMVYIKDYWRPEGGEKEGEIYQTLEEKNVPNIPRFYCGNDVCHAVRRNSDSEEVGDDSEEVDDDSQQVEDNSEEVDNDSQQVDNDSQQVDNDSQQVEDDSEEVGNDSQYVNNDSRQVLDGQEVSKIRTSEWALIYPKTHAVIHYRMALD